MINEYLLDALTGEDAKHADVLLKRRAPASLWVRYDWYGLRSALHYTANGLFRRFVEPIPLQPVGC